jgi:hypothetical protein
MLTTIAITSHAKNPIHDPPTCLLPHLLVLQTPSPAALWVLALTEPPVPSARQAPLPQLGCHYVWTVGLGHTLVMVQTHARCVIPAPMPLVAVLAALPVTLGSPQAVVPAAAMTARRAPLLPNLVLPAVTIVRLAPGHQTELPNASNVRSVLQVASARCPPVTQPRGVPWYQPRMARCAGMGSRAWKKSAPVSRSLRKAKHANVSGLPVSTPNQNLPRSGLTITLHVGYASWCSPQQPHVDNAMCSATLLSYSSSLHEVLQCIICMVNPCVS